LLQLNPLQLMMLSSLLAFLIWVMEELQRQEDLRLVYWVPMPYIDASRQEYGVQRCVEFGPDGFHTHQVCGMVSSVCSTPGNQVAHEHYEPEPFMEHQ